jgi:hypothetical protein
MTQVVKRSLFLLIVVFAFWGCQPASLSTLPASTPQNRQSIFEQDSCAPPCWFGLTPGVSSTDEVIALLQDGEIFSSDARIWGRTPEPLVLIEEGSYLFYWRHSLTVNHQINVENGVVTLISATVDRSVPLRRILERMQLPSFVRFDQVFHVWLIHLFYPDAGVVVMLEVQREICEMNSFLEDTTALQAIYYPVSEYQDFIQQHPHNLWFEVPTETWTQWLSGETEGSCEEVMSAFIASNTPEP